jgi:hypothetical protein
MDTVWKENVEEALDTRESSRCCEKAEKAEEADIVVSFDGSCLSEIARKYGGGKSYVFIQILHRPSLPKGCKVIDVCANVRTRLADIISEMHEKVATPSS